MVFLRIDLMASRSSPAYTIIVLMYPINVRIYKTNSYNCFFYIKLLVYKSIKENKIKVIRETIKLTLRRKLDFGRPRENSGLEPSAETAAPKYLKLVTMPNFCPVTLISLGMPLGLLGGGRVVRWCWVNFQCRGVLQF